MIKTSARMARRIGVKYDRRRHCAIISVVAAIINDFSFPPLPGHQSPGRGNAPWRLDMNRLARCRTRQIKYGRAASYLTIRFVQHGDHLCHYHLIWHNTPDGGIPTIGLPVISSALPSAGMAALNHSAKICNAYLFYVARIPIT